MGMGKFFGHQGPVHPAGAEVVVLGGTVRA
jgi:hypothetical protein